MAAPQCHRVWEAVANMETISRCVNHLSRSRDVVFVMNTMRGRWLIAYAIADVHSNDLFSMAPSRFTFFLVNFFSRFLEINSLNLLKDLCRKQSEDDMHG